MLTLTSYDNKCISVSAYNIEHKRMSEFDFYNDPINK